MTLLQRHLKLIEDSAIREDIREARGYESCIDASSARAAGLSDAQSRYVPALLLPTWTADSKRGPVQMRPDTAPVGKDGKEAKYLFPAGERVVLDVPPACREDLRNVGVPLFITEGIRKADSAASHGLCCIDVLGVWLWRDKSGALPDWEYVATKNRTVYIVFDSDVMTKESVHAALVRLKRFLESRGATVLLIYLPPTEDGKKVGLDDYFAAGGTVENLLTLATPEARPINPVVSAGTPPQSKEAEQAVLGSILLDDHALETAQAILTTSDFWTGAHRTIYAAIEALAYDDRPVDTVTLTERLERAGQLEEVGGVSYLLELLEAPSTAANIGVYAALVRDKAQLRALLDLSTQIPALVKAAPAEAESLIAEVEGKVRDLARGNGNQGMRPLSDVLQTTLDALEERIERKEPISGLRTSIADLDWILGGLQKSDLVILAGRPGMGKTSAMMQMAVAAAKESRLPAAIFSLEMEADKLVQRLLVMEARVDGTLVRSGLVDASAWARIGEAASRLSEIPLYFSDEPSLTVAQIRAKCRRLQREHGLGLILVDYLQMIRQGRAMGNRPIEVGEISRDLKALAKEFKVPVVAAAQLNRSVESRPDKHPMLSDLRDSGEIEQNADVVLFLYRGEYYKQKESKAELSPVNAEIAEILVAKQRDGRTAKIEVGFYPNYVRFENLETYREAESAPEPPAEEEDVEAVVYERPDPLSILFPEEG